MGTIVLPFTFTNGTVASDSEVMSNLNTFRTEFNGLISNVNIKSAADIRGNKLRAKSIQWGKFVVPCITEAKMDYTSLKVLRFYTFPVTMRRMAMGRAEFTFDGATPAKQTVTVTFNGGSDNGNPSFSGPPRVVCSEFYNPAGPGTDPHGIKITAISNTQFTFEVRKLAASGTETGYVDWIAIGVIV